MKVRRNRERLIAFYVTEEEKDIIVSKAYKKDMSLSDYCRKTLVSKEGKEDVREDTERA